jgi:hypothetical protein
MIIFFWKRDNNTREKSIVETNESEHRFNDDNISHNVISNGFKSASGVSAVNDGPKVHRPVSSLCGELGSYPDLCLGEVVIAAVYPITIGGSLFQILYVLLYLHH